MKHLKKFAALFAALAAFFVCFTLAACEDGASPEDTLTGDTEQDGVAEEDGGADAEEELSVPYAYVTQECYVPRGELNIWCKLYLPVAQTALPAVVLSHSAYMTGDSMESYAQGFAQRGYVAVAFDFCGGSSNSRSDGDTADMTVFTEKEDLKAVLAYVQSLDCVRTEEIYLFGTSQGGLVSALVANDLAEEIAGLILLYPAFNIAELAQGSSSQYADIMNAFSSIFSYFGISFGSAGEAYISTLQDFDVYANIGAFKGRVLILHGSQDFIVDSSYSRQAADVYENCQLYIIQGASHGFNSQNYSFFGDYDATVWQYIDAYLS